jgi:hypothetical protein
VNRLQSRRKQTFSDVFKAGHAEALALAPGPRQPGTDSFLRLRSRPERAKARLRMQNPALANYATATLLASSKGLGCSLDIVAWLTTTVRPREIGLRSTFREPLDGLLALMHGQGPADAQNAPHGPWCASDRHLCGQGLAHARTRQARPGRSASGARGQSCIGPSPVRGGRYGRLRLRRPAQWTLVSTSFDGR